MKVAFSLLSLTRAKPSETPPEQVFADAYQQVGEYLHGNWPVFKDFVDNLNTSFLEPVWDFCHDELEMDYDVSLEQESFIGCGVAFAAYYGNFHISFPYWGDFFDAMWEKADWNHSGAVDWDEWRYTEAVLAAIYSHVTFGYTDFNHDDVLDMEEFSIFSEKQVRHLGDIVPDPTETLSGDLWLESQIDDDLETLNKREIALFWINYWNLLVNEG